MPKTQQVAALPWRSGENGVEILLVTTRTTKRWVIPKGWTMAGLADYEAAAIEAFEEAGVRGVTKTLSMGQYSYLKIMDRGNPRRVMVEVFALKVEEELREWPERLERERQWVSLIHAMSIIGEPELLPVIAKFDGSLVGEPFAPKPKPRSRSRSRLLDTFKKWWRWLIT